MARQLDTNTLDAAARYYAATFLRPDAQTGGRFTDGPSFVMQQFYNFTYKDEFDYMRGAIRDWMAAKLLAEFERRAGEVFRPRSEAEFHSLLAKNLAIDPDGAHIPGRVGTSQLHGTRLVGSQVVEVESPESVRFRKRHGLSKEHRRTITKEVPLYWPIYAGEQEERIAGSNAVDPLPPGTPGLPIGAFNTRISNECAILACDSVVDNLDEGTGAAIIEGRVGPQPTDPDTPASGLLLFTLVCDDPAFGPASDDNPGAIATAGPIADDTNAANTGTVGYCRASSSNDGATPLDDHIDGEAGPISGFDFNFNTVSIVSGATVSMTSWTVTMPES